MDDENQAKPLSTILEADFEEALFGEIRLTVKTVLSAVQQCMGVSIVEHLLFMHLFTEKELSQAELQKRLGVDGAVITRLVKQLEARGLVVRRPDPADNRFTLVALTEQAYTLTEEKLARRRKLQMAMMRGISMQDVECLRDILTQIRQNAQELGSDSERM